MLRDRRVRKSIDQSILNIVQFNFLIISNIKITLIRLFAHKFKQLSFVIQKTNIY